MPDSVGRPLHRALFSAALPTILVGCACASGNNADRASAAAKPAASPDASPAKPQPQPAEEAVESEPPEPASEASGRSDEPELPDGYLTFSGACEHDDVVTIAAVGDVLIHRELQKQAMRSPERFEVLWPGVADLLAAADITYANLEGPTAYGITRQGEVVDDPGFRFDNKVYSGYAKFNYHPHLVEDLVQTGIDIVSTANNHALDRESLGVDRTLDALDKAKLRHSGTRRKGTKEPWHTVTEAKGLRIAWLACTERVNFGKDDFDQVLRCFDRKDTVRDLVAKLGRKSGIDAVIVTPHWGKEYSREAGEKQIEHAKKWLDAGAVAVIGAHPHVLQPWEKVTTADGREAFVLYSLGNFASHQRSLDRRSSVILYLGLAENAEGEVQLVGARYVPIHVRMEGDKEAFFVEAIDRVGGKPADARALVVDTYGRHNLMPPDEAPEVRPHCDPEWEFPK